MENIDSNIMDYLDQDYNKDMAVIRSTVNFKELDFMAGKILI